MELVRQANDMILSKQIDYNIIRQVNGMMKKGDRREIVYLVLPDLEEMVTDGQHDFLLPTYEIAVRTVEKVRENTCCIVSAILEPHVGRVDMGSRVVLEKGLHLIVLNPYRHTLSSSGYQTFAGLLRTPEDPELSLDDYSHPVYFRSDEDLEELARSWVEDMEKKGEEITHSSILSKIEWEVRETALEEELIPILVSKMKRIAYRIRCIQDESIIELASEWITEFYKEQSATSIKEFVERYGSNMPRSKRYQILNHMLAVKHNLDCPLEESFKKANQRHREKSAEKELEKKREYDVRKNLLVELGSSRKTQILLHEILRNRPLTIEARRALDKIDRAAGYLETKFGKTLTRQDVDRYVKQLNPTLPEIAEQVRNILLNRLGLY